MSKSEISKVMATDVRSEQTGSFVRTVKATTRRKHPHLIKKIRIVLEGFRRVVTVNDLCRLAGMALYLFSLARFPANISGHANRDTYQHGPMEIIRGRIGESD